MKNFWQKSFILAALFLLLTGCVRSREVVDVEPDYMYTAPDPAFTVTDATYVQTESVVANGVYVDANNQLHVPKNFFEGDRGDYRMRGNFGREGRSWNPGYAQGIRDAGNEIIVDLNWYVSTRNMEHDESYCTTFTSGGLNWRDNSDLLPGQIYISPDGDPNIAVYIDRNGQGEVTNRFADPRKKAC